MSTEDDTCKCGIRRSDCEYHRVPLRDLWAAAIGVRDTIVYAGKDEKILPPSLSKELRAMVDAAAAFVLVGSTKFKMACGHCGGINGHALLDLGDSNEPFYRCPNDPDQSDPNASGDGGDGAT